jgi:hypothetical protein
MLVYVDEVAGEDFGIQVNLPTAVNNENQPVQANQKDRLRCVVCNLEEVWIKKSNMTGHYGNGSRQKRHMAVCHTCGINTHSLPVEWHHRIFQLEPLKAFSVGRL